MTLYYFLVNIYYPKVANKNLMSFLVLALHLTGWVTWGGRIVADQSEGEANQSFFFNHVENLKQAWAGFTRFLYKFSLRIYLAWAFPPRYMWQALSVGGHDRFLSWSQFPLRSVSLLSSQQTNTEKHLFDNKRDSTETDGTRVEETKSRQLLQIIAELTLKDVSSTKERWIR